MLYGAIEAGGTKFVCAVGDEQLGIKDECSFLTTTPSETLAQAMAFFQQYQSQLASIGVGSFGPIDMNPFSATYGYITSTPKEGWQQFDFVGELQKKFSLPIAWTTDVNAAAYGEYVVRENVTSLVYYTIGTGIGGGAIQGGKFIGGFSHPEMGHMLLRQAETDNFEGVCPYHKNCLEGLASGPAIEKRVGRKGQSLPEKDEFWAMEADYLAQCAYNTTLLLRPERIIFGGGVMKQVHLFPKIRSCLTKLLNDYVQTPAMETYIVPPMLGDRAAITGCLALAREKKSDERS